MNRLIKTLCLAATMAATTLTAQAADVKHDFAVGDKTFLMDGKPFVVKAAEVHYPRIPRPYSPDPDLPVPPNGIRDDCLGGY